jgi:hypothetical protein
LLRRHGYFCERKIQRLPILIHSILRSRAILTLIVVLTVTQFVPRAFAQGETASVSGRVTDPSNAAITNAEIQIKNVDTNALQTVTTNNDGFYVFPYLNPGNYLMTATKQGFRSLSVTGIKLNVQDTLSRNFSMQVGSSAESITVNGNAATINTSDGSVGMTVGGDLVQNLPLNGRSFQQLITLAPGVNLTSGQNYGDYGEFSVNGQRPTSNYFMVDGVGANLGSGSVATTGAGEVLNAAGGTNALVSVDALQEFRILTSSFSPEYGRTPGGQVILVTRSGTNSFHGTLFEYFRNDVLDANDWFANRAGAERAALRFNDFGGTLGGPIVKNNTFFFFSYEGQPLRQPEFGITSVPDLASRQAAPAAVQPLLNGFPIPNGSELGNGLAEFSAGYSNPVNANATSFRVDHIFGPKLSAFARYNYAPSSNATRGDGEALSGVYSESFEAQSITTGITYAISPSVVNETRVNWSENPNTTTYALDNFGGATPPSISSLFLAPYSPNNELADVLLVSGGVRLLDGESTVNKPRQVNFVDSVSYTTGAHQLKFGLDYLLSLPVVSPVSQLVYRFNSITNALNNNLSFSNNSTGFVRANAMNLSLYGQDTWKISRRLTLTYGLRWDLNPPPSDRYPSNGNFVPLLGNYSTGDVSVGAAGSSLWNTQYKNFAPRLGLAYQIRQTPGWETVLRAGVGLYYDVATEGIATSSLGRSFPSSQYVSVPNVSFPVSLSTAALPPVSLTNPAPGTTFYAYPKGFAAPRSWQWNVSIQQALGSAQTLTVSYVAALGRDLLYGQYYPSVGPNGYAVYFTDNSASSNYQSFQLQYQRRISHGITAAVTYAWSHSLDDESTDIDSLPPGEVFSAHSNWGPSDFDMRHSFKAAFSWNVPTPSGARWIRAVAGAWGTDGIITAQSALPVDIGSYSNDVLGGDQFFLRPDVVPGQPLYLYGSQYPGGKAFNPAAFVINPNSQGDFGRNALRGFDLVETDLSLRRTFAITERVKLLFRADFFNLFNHANFAGPDPTLDDGTFGQSLGMANTVLGGGSPFSQNSVFQTGGPRTVQLSLKAQF